MFCFSFSLVWRTKWSDSRKLWSISQLPPNRARPTWGPPPSSVSSQVLRNMLSFLVTTDVDKFVGSFHISVTV